MTYLVVELPGPIQDLPDQVSSISDQVFDWTTAIGFSLAALIGIIGIFSFFISTW